MLHCCRRQGRGHVNGGVTAHWWCRIDVDVQTVAVMKQVHGGPETAAANRTGTCHLSGRDSMGREAARL